MRDISIIVVFVMLLIYILGIGSSSPNRGRSMNPQSLFINSPLPRYNMDNFGVKDNRIVKPLPTTNFNVSEVERMHISPRVDTAENNHIAEITQYNISNIAMNKNTSDIDTHDFIQNDEPGQLAQQINKSTPDGTHARIQAPAPAPTHTQINTDENAPEFGHKPILRINQSRKNKKQIKHTSQNIKFADSVKCQLYDVDGGFVNTPFNIELK